MVVCCLLTLPWQAEGVQSPPKMVPALPAPLAKHEKAPQLPPYQTKML